MTRFCQVIDYYTHILEREGERLKFPKILFFWGQNTPVNQLSQFGRQINRFSSFWTKHTTFGQIFSLDKKRGQEGQKGQDRQTERREDKEGAREKEGKGYIPRRGGGGKLIISTLTKKRKISTPYIVYNILYRLI